MVAVLVLLTIAACLTVDYFVRRAEAARRLSPVGAGPVAGAIAPSANGSLTWGDVSTLAQVPTGTYLAAGHTWVRPTEDGTVRLGADRLPAHALGGIDHVQLLERGSRVRAGQPIATLGRGRRLVRLVSPVEGTIEASNPELERSPDTLTRDPFRQGWLYSIRPSRLAPALRRMYVAEEATSWMRREIGRLRDVISRIGLHHAEPVPVLLDGGVPVDGFAERLSDEQWVAVVEALFEAPPTTERSI